MAEETEKINRLGKIDDGSYECHGCKTEKNLTAFELPNLCNQDLVLCDVCIKRLQTVLSKTMTPEKITAKTAYECAEAIMKGNGERAWALKMAEYFGEWNTLMLYLSAQVRQEEAVR